MSLRNDPEPTNSWDTSGDSDTDNLSPILKTRPRRHADSQLLALFFRLSSGVLTLLISDRYDIHDSTRSSFEIATKHDSAFEEKKERSMI